MAEIEVAPAIEPLADEWDALCDRVGARPFSRPGWFVAWSEAFRTGPLVLITLRRGGRFAGVLPLFATAGALRSASNWHSPEFGPVAEDLEGVTELTRAVFERRPSQVVVYFLERGEPGLGAFRAAAARGGYLRYERLLERSPYVAIDGSWAEYLDTLERKFLRDADRRRRRLEEEGAVAVEVAAGEKRLDELLTEGFELESSGWKGETAVLADASAQRFYTALAGWAASRGALRLAFLRVGGRAIAFQLGIEDGGVYYFLKGGYDPAYRRFAPARLLVHALLERAFALRLHSFEFLGADDSWKLDWTQTTRERRELRAFAPTPLGAVRWTAFTYGRPAAKRIRWVDSLVLRSRR